MAVWGLGNRKNDKLGLVDSSDEPCCGSLLSVASAGTLDGKRAGQARVTEGSSGRRRSARIKAGRCITHKEGRNAFAHVHEVTMG